MKIILITLIVFQVLNAHSQIISFIGGANYNSLIFDNSNFNKFTPRIGYNIGITQSIQLKNKKFTLNIEEIYSLKSVKNNDIDEVYNFNNIILNIYPSFKRNKVNFYCGLGLAVISNIEQKSGSNKFRHYFYPFDVNGLVGIKYSFLKKFPLGVDFRFYSSIKDAYNKDFSIRHLNTLETKWHSHAGVMVNISIPFVYKRKLDQN